MLPGGSFCEGSNNVPQCQETLVDLNPLVELLTNSPCVLGTLATWNNIQAWPRESAHHAYSAQLAHFGQPLHSVTNNCLWYFVCQDVSAQMLQPFLTF